MRVLLFETPDDPYYNLAFEEAFFLARCYDLTEDDTLRIWRNSNAVIIGYFQYADEEVHMDRLREMGGKVVRRFTGGGAVYHDLGNINYAIAVKKELSPEENLIDSLYKFLLKGVIFALNKFNVRAKIENINDIVIENHKVSGCAAKICRDTLFLHGSLLIDTDLDKLISVLKVSKKKLEDKGISSAKYRVTTLSSILKRKIEHEEVVDALVEEYEKILNTKSSFDLPSRAELDLTRKLYKKYLSDEWNLRREPSWKYNELISEIIRSG